MSRTLKRSAAFAAAALTAVTISAAGAGTAGAATQFSGNNGERCIVDSDFELGALHAGQAVGDCGFLHTGQRV